MDKFEELDNLVQKILKMSEKDIQKNYKNTLEDLRTTIRKQYDKYEKSGKLDIKEMSKYDRIKKFDEEVKDRLSNLYKDNNSLINATLTNICETTRDVVIDTAEKKTKKSLMAIKKNLDVEKTVNEEMAGLKWADRTAHHRGEVIYQVQKTLKEGLSQGSTYKEMSDRLTETLNKDVVQPMRIIRTEGARVHASTQMQAFDKMAEKGLKMTKKWVTAKDERVRDMHRQMDGVVVPYEEDFTLPDGTKTKMPHLSGVAKHDIHCRCIVTIDFKENSSKNTLNAPEIKERKLKTSYENLSEILNNKANTNEHANRMNMYMQMTDYVEDDKYKSPFSYIVDEDIIKYNPKHPYYKYYNLSYAQVHELSHRMDILQYNSIDNKNFTDSIEKSRDIFYNNEEQIKKWFDDKDGIYSRNEAVSDIISALSMSDANEYLPYAHDKKYWERGSTVVREIFANLSSIDILDDGLYKEFKSSFAELFNSYLEVVR